MLCYTDFMIQVDVVDKTDKSPADIEVKPEDPPATADNFGESGDQTTTDNQKTTLFTSEHFKIRLGNIHQRAAHSVSS